MKLHPYAIIIGLVIGVMVFFTLRHPLFAPVSYTHLTLPTILLV